jgi:uroporphyrinogen III methyltransferase/synthase
MECSKDPKTPLAFIEKGTTPFQRTVMATLETAGETIVRENVTAPAITIMGGVVELGKSLAWRKNLPLSGKRLVVTRAAKQASGISARLTALGAEVIETPMIETRDVTPVLFNLACHSSSRLDSCGSPMREQAPALSNLACHSGGSEATDRIHADFNDLKNFDILAFTSTNGVESFFKQLFAAGYDVRVLAGKKIASVGKITEKKLLEYGIRCDYVPEDHTGEGLGKLLRSVVDTNGAILSECRDSKDLLDESRILLLQGNLADDTLLKLLPKATRWIVYETLPVSALPEWKREAVESADAVVFASTSAVENFVKAMCIEPSAVSAKSKDLDSRLRENDEFVPSRLSSGISPLSFCIGRMTESAACKHGFETVTSDETTMDSLVKKIVEYYA